jgi:hypothetical protein
VTVPGLSQLQQPGEDARRYRLLRGPQVSTAIIGAKSPEQLRDIQRAPQDAENYQAMKWEHKALELPEPENEKTARRYQRKLFKQQTPIFTP